MQVHGGRIETLKQSGTLGLGLRVIVDGAVGFCSGTDLSPAGLVTISRSAPSRSRFATPDEDNGSPPPADAGTYAGADPQLFDPAALEAAGRAQDRPRSSSSASRSARTRA